MINNLYWPPDPTSHDVSELPRPPASRSGRRSRCCADWASAVADPGRQTWKCVDSWTGMLPGFDIRYLDGSHMLIPPHMGNNRCWPIRMYIYIYIIRGTINISRLEM